MAKPRPSAIPWAGIPLIATVARLLCRELTLQNEYLREENRILKSRIKGRIIFSDDERSSLVKKAVAMGRDLMKAVVSIVKPDTILAWQRRLERSKWDYSERRKRKPGRPRKPREIEQLVCQLARENIWGYRRIRGELLKIAIVVSKSCIADMLRRNDLPIAPNRKGLTWHEFLSRHMDVLISADLLTKEIWTFCGLKTAYVLMVMHMKSRTVLLCEATFSPNARWMSQMARNILLVADELGIQPRYVLHDRDFLFSYSFDPALHAADVKVLKTPYRSPNLNAHCERVIRTVRDEVLNHLIIFGLSRLQNVLDKWKYSFNHCRPHQGIQQHRPEQVLHGLSLPEESLAPIRPSDVECTEYLGGLLKSYSRKAA